MKTPIPLILASCLALASYPTFAEESGDDWKLFGGMLSLIQSVVHAAATTDDPQAVQKRVDALLAGRDAEANQMAGKLLNEVVGEIPAQYHGTVSALAQDILTIARRNKNLPPAGAAELAIQARKDLAAMGLRYYDPAQFLEAVRRDDVLAVELYIRGRGLNIATRDAEGRNALEIARQNGNRQMIDLLSAAQ